MSLINNIYNRVCKVEWCVAIRKRNSNNLDFSIDETPYKIIKNSFRYWAADPFVIEFKNRQLIFVELYDRFKRKGLLGYMDITDGVQGDYKVVYEEVCHLSYPMVFIHNGELYAIPESNNIKKLIVLKWNSDAFLFEKIGTIMEDFCCADTNFLVQGKVIYMLTTPVDKTDNVGKLSIFKRDERGIFIPCSKNPVVEDKTTARNGGAIIKKDGDNYRVSQDCGAGYGAGLNVLRIDNISESEYRETLIKKILPCDIHIEGIQNVDGIHTYNCNDVFEVIDFKISHKFSLAETIGFILCKFHVYNKVEK